MRRELSGGDRRIPLTNNSNAHGVSKPWIHVISVPSDCRKKCYDVTYLERQLISRMPLHYEYLVNIMPNNRAGFSPQAVTYPGLRCPITISGKMTTAFLHDVIKWKHFPCYWPFVRGIRRSPVYSPHKGQQCGALAFHLICAWINGWVNNRREMEIFLLSHSTSYLKISKISKELSIS